MSAERTGSSGPAASRWHAVWTRSNWEQSVADEIAALGWEAFLPRVPVWTWRAGERRLVDAPLLPGHVFVRGVLDRRGYAVLARTRGLVSVLGEGWGRPTVVPDEDIAALRALIASGVPLTPFPCLRVGRRVRVERGPLAGLEGVPVRGERGKVLLVVSIDVVGRGVAAALDAAELRAA